MADIEEFENWIAEQNFWKPDTADEFRKIRKFLIDSYELPEDLILLLLSDVVTTIRNEYGE